MSGPVTSVARVDVQIFLKDPVCVCVCVCVCIYIYICCAFVGMDNKLHFGIERSLDSLDSNDIRPAVLPHFMEELEVTPSFMPE